jgi:type III restriction enzyme
MKLTLTDYQTLAVQDVLDALEEASARFQKNSKPTAVSLTAVTGAGKTVIAAAVLETLLHGSDKVDPVPGTTVLWVTDDPSLNEQTRRKMLVASDRILPGQLVTIDERLDQRLLGEDVVYFLNVQKLGKGATKYVATGDRRRYSLWDTIRQTIRERGHRFLLVIDEAHRGTGIGSNGEGKTIATRLVQGMPADGTPASPIVLGISATPDRFNEAVRGGGRLLHPVEVDIEEVRKSGLIKDLVKITYPTTPGPSDSTFVERAVADVMAYDEQWSAYATAAGEPPVRPVLVVQIPAAIPSSDVEHVLDTIREEWKGLGPNAIGHSLQEHARLEFGSHSVRYIAPQDIQDDEDVRVVLFKEALTTGWDCPRAEVMVSLRAASDHTYIAQLIGRMVRTPLARRITSSEQLNSVSLHLPRFDEVSVERVVAKLRSGDEQVTADATTRAIVCRRNNAVPADVWDAARAVPTYTRPARTHRNEVARLNAFVQLLASVGIDREAPKTARQHIVQTMEREATRLGAKLEEEIASVSSIAFETRTTTRFETDKADTTIGGEQAIDDRDVDELFRRARRVFGDAAANWYWNEVCDGTPEGSDVDPVAAKIKVVALSSDTVAVDAVQDAASALVATLRADHASSIAGLGEADREKVYQIYQQSRDAQEIDVILPEDIMSTAPEGTPAYEKHLYASDAGRYPIVMNDWESAVVAARLPSASAWYRNPTSGSRAVGVPYHDGGVARTMYPDFLFFRSTEDGVATDIFDPHDPSRADTASKWVGLSEYAQKHKDELGQVLAVIEADDGNMWTLDLRQSRVLERLKKATNESEIREVFKDFGGRL